MKEYLTQLINPLLDNPNSLNIMESEDEKGKLFSIRVSKVDMGRIIGKEGNTISAIRNILHSVAVRRKEVVNLKVLEPIS